MKKRTGILLSLALSVALLGRAQTTSPPISVPVDRPDLVPILHSPLNGEISVKNVGNGPAAPSKLTWDCIKVGTASEMHSCPNIPISFATTYYDPTFPDNATIKVPALAPGATFTHKLAFWDVSTWPKGKYKFMVRVDAAHTLVESNTENNVATGTLTIP